MNNDIDIHQLDPARQVLFILNKDGGILSAEQIKEKLLAYRIAINERRMKLFLSSTFGDSRNRHIKNGLVHKTKDGYEIMQKGIEYLKSTVLVLDPSNGSSNQDTVGNIISNLSGDIKLCDPYFDDTAYTLIKTHLRPRKIKSIRVIFDSNKINSTTNYKIGSHLIELKKKKGLHDRFIIDDRSLYFFGASLNHLDNKLSFVFNLTVYKGTFEEIFQNYWDI